MLPINNFRGFYRVPYKYDSIKMSLSELSLILIIAYMYLIFMAGIVKCSTTTDVETAESISNTTSAFIYNYNETTTTLLPEVSPTQSNLLDNNSSDAATIDDHKFISDEDNEEEREETQSNLTKVTDSIKNNQLQQVDQYFSTLKNQNISNTVPLLEKNSESPFSSIDPSIDSAITTYNSTEPHDDDLIEVVASLANTNLQEEDHHNFGIKNETREAESNSGGNLNDLEDSSSSINTASVLAPKSANGVQSFSNSASVNDQLTQPSVTRVHQVWAASTSDADELSPEIIGRMSNNVPFLAAYAVRPRIVRASKSSVESKSALIQAQPTMSNVDYSEIQVESSSTTSHHHKKQTKLKQKKSKSSRDKKSSADKKKSIRRKNDELLAHRRHVVDMARRSVKRRRALRRQQNFGKRIKSRGNNKSKSRLQLSRKLSRITGLRRKLDRSNRVHHMNAIKFGRYHQEGSAIPSSKGNDISAMNVDSLLVDDQMTLAMTPENTTGTKGSSESVSSEEGVKGGSAIGRRKRPFYASKHPSRDEETDGASPVDKDNRQDSSDGEVKPNSVDYNPDRVTSSGRANNDGPTEKLDENLETVTVEPKYDGVDDDPEYFDDRGGSDEGRIDDVGYKKPNVNDKGSKTNGGDGENGEKIDGDDEGQVPRRDLEETSGSRGKDDGGEDFGIGDYDGGDRSSSSGGNGGMFQGDDEGDRSALGGGIGATIGGSSSPLDGMGDKSDGNSDNDDGNNNNGNVDANKTVGSDDGRDNNRGDDRSMSNDGDIDDPNNGGDRKDDFEKEFDTKMDDGTLEADDIEERRPINKKPAFERGSSNTGLDGNDDSQTLGHNSNENNFVDSKDISDATDRSNNSGHQPDYNVDMTIKEEDSKTHVGMSNKNHHEYHCNHGGDGHHDHHDTIKWLQDAIPGEPDVDYPILWKIPNTKFNCRDQKYPGYYADVEARCQVFHICQADGRQDSFLCSNGTIFSQTSSVCVWWNSFDCEDAPKLYERNSLLYRPMTTNNNSRGTDLRPITMMRGSENFDDFMKNFMLNGGKTLTTGLSKDPSPMMSRRQEPDDNRSKENTLGKPKSGEGLEGDDAVQRKSTDIAISDESDGNINTSGHLRSGPTRKRRASRQPPKLKPKRASSRLSRRRKLRHGVKPKGRRP